VYRRSSLAFGIGAQQPFGGIGDVQPSVGRDVISGAAISSLAEEFNCTSAMPSYELAGDMFNKIVFVHGCQNSGSRCSLLRPAAETWLIGRMSDEVYKLLWQNIELNLWASRLAVQQHVIVSGRYVQIEMTIRC
jgi:hypothetical protein